MYNTPVENSRDSDDLQGTYYLSVVTTIFGLYFVEPSLCCTSLKKKHKNQFTNKQLSPRYTFFIGQKMYTKVIYKEMAERR